MSAAAFRNRVSVTTLQAADDRALHANDANAKEAAAVPSKIMEEEKEEKVVSQPSAAILARVS